MQKIVINKGFGRFDLSYEAMELYKTLKGIPQATSVYAYELDRHSPHLVQVVEQLGERADRYGSLKVVEIPDGVEWHVGEYDGREWVAENHRTWRN